MTKTTACSLLAVAMLMMSCTSERNEERTSEIAPAPDSASQGAASPASTAAPAPAATGTEWGAQPNDDAPGAADPQPAGEPGGVLPLQPGVYVLQGSGCSAPANAGVRFYDGVGLSGSATHACRARVLSRRGNAYVVDQSCIDRPSGDGPRTSESQTITVHDARTFTLATPDKSARFRHCPPGELPEYLRERMALPAAKAAAADRPNAPS
ncbi:hypothetical protein ACFQZQ_04045 [Lysobacter koreensis]|uniref:Lipoprotein n=1 Tax=Lysobacter koreensis TaxID=266122 RepID=A0ABW2YJ87_9GAMM